MKSKYHFLCFCFGTRYVYSNPILGIAVVGMVDKVISFYQFYHLFFWTFYGYVCKVVDVEVAEDVPTDREGKHILCSLELLKGTKLIYVLSLSIIWFFPLSRQVVNNDVCHEEKNQERIGSQAGKGAPGVGYQRHQDIEEEGERHVAYDAAHGISNRVFALAHHIT